MAVAADSHRVSLSPNVPSTPDNEYELRIPMLCVYSFVKCMIAHMNRFFNSFLKNYWNFTVSLQNEQVFLPSSGR